MMKILLVHPQISPEHEWVSKLKLQGHAVLTSDQEKEAWQILQLHAESVDLVVIHREGAGGKGEPGFELVKKIKRTPEFVDLPYVLTSEFMDTADFGQHQRTPLGANAYLRAPFTTENLLDIIEQVLPSEKSISSTATHAGTPPPSTDGLTRVLVGPGAVSSKPTSVTKILELPKADSHVSDSGAIVIEEASFTPTHTKGLTPTIHFDLGEPDSGQNLDANATRVMNPLPTAQDSGVIVVGEEPGIDLDLGSNSGVEAISESLGNPIETFDFESSNEGAASVFEGEPAFSLSEQTRSTQTREPEIDVEAAEAMPYVFSNAPQSREGTRSTVQPHHQFTQPVDDSIIPGGASGNADLETLKKYLLFREQDVAVLSNQLKETRQQLEEMNQVLRLERAMATEMKHTVEEQRRRIEGFETERRVLTEGFEREANELRFQIKGKSDKARLFEAQVKEAVDEVERIKERVRLDIRKIRTREKELENRLEINRRDGEALLTLRESRIVELKRKLDLLEFNMDLLQNQYERERTNNKKLRELFERASQVVKVAGGLLEVNEPTTDGQGGSSTGDGHGSAKAAS